jgi:hypothetical protein
MRTLCDPRPVRDRERTTGLPLVAVRSPPLVAACDGEHMNRCVIVS